MAKIIISENQLEKIINQVLNEQSVSGEVFKGPQGDPYEYLFKNNKFFYRNPSQSPKWVEATKASGIAAIKKLYDKHLSKKSVKPKTDDTGKTDTQKDFDFDFDLFGGRKPTEENGQYIIPFAFPDYQPKIDGDGEWDKFVGKVTSLVYGGSKEGTYGYLGHAGVATIEPNGVVRLFEFGRYSRAKKGYGIVISKNLGKIAKIVGGKLSNADNVVKLVKSRTEGEGPRLTMEARLVPVPDVNSAIQYANSVKTKKYSALDYSISNEAANCSTFVQEVANASKIALPLRCYPAPVNMVKNSFEGTSIKSFTI